MFTIQWERRVECGATREEIESILQDYARLFRVSFQKRGSGKRWVVTGGAFLAGNPNDVRWETDVEGGEGELRIRARVKALPWTGRRVRRLAEARVEQLVDYIQTRLRGGNVAKFAESASLRPFLPVAPGPYGICVALASWGAQACGALGGAFAAALLVGLFVTAPVIRQERQRVETVERLGGIPLPSRAELDSIDLGFRLGVSAVLMLPIAFLFGFGYALVQILGDLWRPVSRLAGWVAAFFGLWWIISLCTQRVGVAFLGVWIPMGAHVGHSLVWSIRRERRREPGDPDRLGGKRAIYYGLGGAVAVVLAILAVIPFPGGDFVMRLVAVRDRFLLSNKPGRIVAEGYYRYTRYAAEAINPLFELPDAEGGRDPGALRTAIVCGRDGRLEAAARTLGLEVESLSRKEEVISAISNGGHDFCLVEERSIPLTQEELTTGLPVLLLLRSVEIEERPLAVRLAENSKSRYRAGGLNGLSGDAWRVLFFGAPLFFFLVVMGIVSIPLAVLYRVCPRRWANLAVGILFCGSVVACGLILRPHGDGIRKIRGIRTMEVAQSEAMLLLLRDGSGDVRFEALLRCWQWMEGGAGRSPAFYEPMIESLSHSDLRVRIWAVNGLGKLGDRRAIPALLRAMEDREMLVRYRAAWALGELRAKEAAEPLRRMMRERGWYEGAYALAALREIGVRP